MHVTIMALGSRGDVQPYIALGQGLHRAGHTVRIAAPEDFEALAVASGLQFHAIDEDSRDMMAGDYGQRLIQTGENITKYISIIAQMAKQRAQHVLEAAWTAAQGTDAMIFNMYALMGYHIGEKLNVPTFAAWIYPMTPTSYYPSMGVPGGANLGPVLNRASYKVHEQIIHWLFHDLFGMWREFLDLPPMQAGGFYQNLFRRNIPILHAYSPSVMPAPADWPDHFRVTGYWFLEEVESWLPPDDLLAFLAAGPPPVYVGFGSLFPSNPDDIGGMVIEALGKTGQRGIITTGLGKASIGQNDDIYVLDQAPHDWLFPQVSAVVHHGGAGTTAAGLKAGVPGILIPFMGDQPFWGQRVKALGVGPKPIPFKQLSAARLAKAIHTATTTHAMQEQACKLGQQIRVQDGITEAVRTFQQYI